jgi:ABC-2 type transport system permease protein
MNFWRLQEDGPLIKFIRLIQNENMKMFSRVGNWVMLGVFLLNILLVWAISPSASDFPNIPNTTDTLFSYYLSSAVSPMVIITALAIIWSAGIMAAEFSSGTVKLLLIRPVTRSKILWSKYILVVLYALGLTAVYFVLILLFGFIKYSGVSFINDDVTKFVQSSVLLFVEALFMITLTYMVAVLSHNRSLALGLSLFLYLSNTIIGAFLQNKAWADYLFFSHLNLTKYVQGGLLVNTNTTLLFALGILGAYFIVFLVATWYSFIRRDVTS